MATEAIQYGSQSIVFEIERKERKTLAIEVNPNLSVNVIAPPQVSVEEIKSRVLKRASWIVKQKNYFDQFLPRMPKKEYIAGESHLYLGKKYMLKLRQSEQENVKLIAGNLVVNSRTASDDKTRVKSLLSEWYRLHAIRTFDRILLESLQEFRRFTLDTPPLEIKRMKARWGSCTPSGKIILNPEIIKSPTKCIEYIIVHELCHLVCPQHNKRFYTLLESIMPDWERWKLRLEKLNI